MKSSLRLSGLHDTKGTRKDLCDRSAECLRVSIAFGERLIEPGPADLWQDGVCGDFKIDVGIDVRDDSSGAFPGGLTRRIMQHHQAPGTDEIFANFDIDRLRVSKRGQSGGCRGFPNGEFRSVLESSQ